MWFCYTQHVHTFLNVNSHFWHETQLAGLPKNFPEEGEETGNEEQGEEG